LLFSACPCPCSLNTVAQLNDVTEETLHDLMNQLVKELTINPKKTSLALRKRTSIYEDRLLAKGLGVIGIIILIIVLSLIILPDIPRIKADIKIAWSNIKSRFYN